MTPHVARAAPVRRPTPPPLPSARTSLAVYPLRSRRLAAALGVSGATADTFVYASLCLMMALKVLGALAIIGGGWRCGAVMLAAFLVIVTPIAHWPMGADGKLDQQQAAQFFKNVSLLGGTICLYFGNAFDAPKVSATAAAPKAAGVDSDKKGR